MDGQMKTVLCVSTWMTSRLGSISRTQMTPCRSAASAAVSASTSAPISGVSGAPASRMSWADSGIERAARSR
jgi:hypothetical protein